MSLLLFKILPLLFEGALRVLVLLMRVQILTLLKLLWWFLTLVVLLWAAIDSPISIFSLRFRVPACINLAGRVMRVPRAWASLYEAFAGQYRQAWILLWLASVEVASRRQLAVRLVASPPVKFSACVAWDSGEGGGLPGGGVVVAS
jgi:hypothetical protein